MVNSFRTSWVNWWDEKKQVLKNVIKQAFDFIKRVLKNVIKRAFEELNNIFQDEFNKILT